MENPPSSVPSEPSSSIIKAYADATEQMLKAFPAPGSLAAAALLTGRVICRKCHALNEPEANYCQNCGNLMDKPAPCPACHKARPIGANYCPECGKSAK